MVPKEVGVKEMPLGRLTSTCDDGGPVRSSYFQGGADVTEVNSTDKGHHGSQSHGVCHGTKYLVSGHNQDHKKVSASPDGQTVDTQKSPCRPGPTGYPMDDFKRLLTGAESEGVTTVEEWFKIYRQANSKLMNTYNHQAYPEEKGSHGTYLESSHGMKHPVKQSPCTNSHSEQKTQQSTTSGVGRNTDQRTSASTYSDVRHDIGDRTSESAYSNLTHGAGERMTQSAYSDRTDNQNTGERMTQSVYQNLGHDKEDQRTSASTYSDVGHITGQRMAESVFSNVGHHSGEKTQQSVYSNFSHDSCQGMIQPASSCSSPPTMNSDSPTVQHTKLLNVSQVLHKGDNSHREESVPACWVCRETFHKLSELIRHVKTHEDGQAHQCHVCGRTFTRGDSLIRHSRIHTGVKPYTCTLCGRSFTMSGSLKSHVLVHTKERRFKCDVCLKCFSRSDTLSRHAQTHVTETSLTCDVCKKRFRNANVLRCHVQRHMEDERKLTCVDCDKVFSRPDSLTRHKQSHCIKKTDLKRNSMTLITQAESLCQEDRFKT
ncbi:zinc finger protein 16-like isoform X2 [Gigantopelta aegis]|uniref:zinc finger protein 16-like isoform X2 n=1 Tax=Gigantopelta aegis TaxID=1735272 RepID=UPI001B8884E9|nr:zinc finger protein 16-like isoform X2 [Gigantopelta aegis]